MRRFAALILVPFLNAAAAAEPVDYLRDIKPILRARCCSCHGALRQKAKLRLDTAALIRKGGRHGPAVVAGKGDESLLIDAVTGSGRPRMPPEAEGAPLTPQQVALLKTWIDQGARAPQEATPEDPRDHWAFRVPVRPAAPRVAQPDWVRNPIDAFIAAEHDKHGLRPRPPASKEVLLRRVYLDLVGLPPTREELHAFLADPAPGAYEKVVDHLLASPQYGERWGRHWMDVWRYSDWYGRRAVPDWWNSAPQVWRWRDWIVRSLNNDTGYDRMVEAMLAADEITPEDDEAVVATGYIARNWYALNYHQWMRDQVEHTAKSFLGLTLNCAHCHDHKYDPITQEEYFRFRALFEPIELRQDRVPGEPDPGPFQKYQYLVLHKVVKSGAIRVVDERLDARTYMYAGGDERNRIAGRPPVAPGVPAFLGGEALTITPVSLPPTAYYPGLKPFVRQEETARRKQAIAAARSALARSEQALASAQERLQAVEAMPSPRRPPPAIADARTRARAAVASATSALQRDRARLATVEAERESLRARIAADDAAYGKSSDHATSLARAASKAEHAAALCAAQEQLLQAEQAHTAADRRRRTLRQKADSPPADKVKDQAATPLKQAEQRLAAARKAVESARQALAAPGTKYTPLSPVYPKTSTGRRAALARWLASPQNPLTARVAVNHIWMRHFGRPLVETVFDFGRNGKRPTHPELLDWLAVEFMESGWSMKRVHRLLVTSNTYRMGSSIADSSLFNPQSADPNNRYLWHFNARRVEAEVVRDSILHAAGGLELRMGGPELENNQADASRRRSLYFSIHPEDGGHFKFLELFDAPDPCECYRRTESLVPQQALALTNSQLSLDQSRLLARKLWATVAGDPDREEGWLTAAFEQVLSRRPTSGERAVCLDFLVRQEDLYRRTDPKQLAVPAAAGAVPPSPDPRMRARESLVHTLFSHNDFTTIR